MIKIKIKSLIKEIFIVNKKCRTAESGAKYVQSDHHFVFFCFSFFYSYIS